MLPKHSEPKNQTTGGNMSKKTGVGYAATVLLISATMLFTSAAQAMEIKQFDKMADQDKAEYVADLIMGAQKVLIDEGKSDLADKVYNLFTKIPPGDKISIGMNEFERNLDILRLADAKNHESHPNDPRVEVEDAMALTLQKNGINLPDRFYSVAKNFKPKHPLKSSDGGNEKKN